MIFEVGLPRRTMTDKNDAIKYINNNNGIKAVYKTVYTFEKLNDFRPDYNTCNINKLFFDFDTGDAWGECNKLHNYCLEKNIAHMLFMSGRGYHLFVLTKMYKTETPKQVIYNAQHHFIDLLNLICDTQVVGDPARLHRVPNTYNLKAKRFCIPLTKEQFDMGDGTIKLFAEKQNPISNNVIGEELFDISNFDYAIENIEYNFKCDYNCDVLNQLDYTKGCPNCIKEILLNTDAGWKERYLLILYFKELGYTKQEVADILKNHLSERKYKHCIIEENQLKYLFSRDDLIFPKCDNIEKDGLCTGKCEQYGKVIYK